MIFVTVGTTQDFDELIMEIDRLIESGIIKEKVIAQTGNGNYKPKHIEHFRFTSDINKFYKESRLVICHGGVGSVYELLHMGKMFIAVSNRKMKDDHQSDLLSALKKRNYCHCCMNISDLESILSNIQKLEPYRVDENLAKHIWEDLLSI